MCWENSSASPGQQSQCFEAWSQYLDVIGEQYPNHWPLDLVDLVHQEGDYWEGLSYTEFANQWNSSRPPSSTNPGERLQDGATFALGAAVMTGPTPEDWLWIIGGLCLVAAAGIAQTISISLPLRQLHNFTLEYDDIEKGNIPEPDEDECYDDWIFCEDQCYAIHHGYPNEIRACREECFLEYQRCLELRPRFD